MERAIEPTEWLDATGEGARTTPSEDSARIREHVRKILQILSEGRREKRKPVRPVQYSSEECRLTEAATTGGVCTFLAKSDGVWLSEFGAVVYSVPERD
jgi:hypothetical protein